MLNKFLQSMQNMFLCFSNWGGGTDTYICVVLSYGRRITFIFDIIDYEVKVLQC